MNTEFSQAVRNRVLAQLADNTLGFNAHLAFVAPTYGINPFTFDFGSGSRNFFETSIDPDDIETSTPLRYPLATLISTSAQNTHRSVFQTFSGEVSMVLTIYITWSIPKVPQNTERLGGAVEAAVIRTFCDTDNQGNFTGPVTFNRTIGVTRAPVQMGGEHWRQALVFTLTFQLDTD